MSLPRATCRGERSYWCSRPMVFLRDRLHDRFDSARISVFVDVDHCAFSGARSRGDIRTCYAVTAMVGELPIKMQFARIQKSAAAIYLFTEYRPRRMTFLGYY